MEAAPPEVSGVRPGVRWRDSLFFRVMVLCVVLVLCLFGMVAAVTQYYVNESVREMEQHVEQVTNYIYATLAAHPELSDEALLEQIEGTFGLQTEFRPGEPVIDASVHIEFLPEGMQRVARTPITLHAQDITMVIRSSTAAQAEILKALKNRYMLSLLSVFFVTICLMVYVIARALRPLQELNSSIAAISAGKLQQVSTRHATGEVRALEETFNHMVNALQEKELVESKLRQAQRLSALGNLAAGVAHDVRNPLNAIKLLSSHALDTLDQQSAAVKPLRTIRDEVNRLEDIVSSFLSLAKEREVVLAPVKIDLLLQECVRLFQQDARAREVRLQQELRAGDTLLMVDQKQFTRAVLNILLNALEACPPGGRVRLFSRITDRDCEIEIRDDGPGMSREALEQVFDPYFTTKPGGTGLGLSITRGIIEEHGGAIELSCVEGQGCQALITMPLNITKAR